MLKIISFFMGICGFSYEVLLNRSLSTIFGSVVYIQGAVLFSFLLFIGIGALFADRLRRHLSSIFLILGVFTVFLFFLWRADTISLIPKIQSIPVRVILSIILTAPGAFLIGTIIPILTDLQILNNNSSRKQSFVVTYLFYHLGAGAIIVLLDLWWIPVLGIKAALLFLATIIFIISFIFNKNLFIENGDFHFERLDSIKYTIFFIGLISGVFQLALLKTHFHFFGPFPENFTFMIATSVISLGFSSILIKLGLINLKRWLIILPIFLVLYLFYIWGGIYGVSYINQSVDLDSGFYDKLLRFIMIFCLYSPAYIIFGCLLPVFHLSDKFNTKAALSINSIANAIGFLIAMFGFYHILSLKMIIILCVAAVIIYIVVIYRDINKVVVSSLVAVLFLTVWGSLFKDIVFHFSYRFFESVPSLNYYLKNALGYKSYRAGGTEVSLIKTQGGDIVVIDGYKTLRLKETIKEQDRWASDTIGENRFEFLVGAMQGYITPEHNNSLILGVGTGITVTANSLFYKNIDAIEVNKAILSMQNIFNNFNYNLLSRKNVNIHYDDGFNFLINSNKKYDLIVNNVPTPQYSVSAKIWTLDFLRSIKKQLTPQGAYSIWLNGGINPKATKIILKTMKQEFNNCYLAIIHPMYSNLICSKTLVDIQQPVSHSDINNYVSDFKAEDLKYLIFPVKNIKSFDDIPINTLDRPTLPYYLDPILSQSWVKNKPWYIFDYVDIDWSRMPDAQDGMLKKRCEILNQWASIIGGVLPNFCK